MASFSAMADEPAEVPAPVSKIFIPFGFDSNDNVEVVAHGEFPNSCWRVGKTSATVDHETNTIYVDVTAYQYPEGERFLCAQVIMPYIAPVKLGILKTGEYTVVAGANQDVRAQLHVEEATTQSPDDHMYAQVDSAEVVALANGEYELQMSGTHPYFYIGCMKITEVKTYLRPDDVLVALPIGEIEEVCPESYSHHFKVRHKIENMFLGKGLLHIRALNGDSYNKLIQLGL